MARNAVLQSFYGSEKWARFRTAVIAERGPVCQRCGKLITDRLDIILHHAPAELTEANVNDAMVALNTDNVQIVCFRCHGEIHQRFGSEDEGRHVYLVYGPPMAGKTSLVREHARYGDIIVDIDLLFHAVSLQPACNKPQRLNSMVFGMRDLLIDNIKTRYGRWKDAWVVGGYPVKHERDKLAEDLGAELVYCECSQDECMRRLLECEERIPYREEYKRYIAQWFERFVA